MTWDKCKVWTSDELEEWTKKQQEENAKYRIEADRQLEEWVKGNSIHNPMNPITAVVNDDQVVVGYIQTEGGECCPDFSCCGNKIWPVEKRIRFAELHRSGNREATMLMLMGAMSDLASTVAEDGVYIAGQLDDKQTLH